MIDPIQARQAVRAACSVSPRTTSQSAQNAQSTSNQGMDTVSISGPGRLMASLPSLFGADENGNVTLESMREAVEEETCSFRSDLAVMLAQAGVSDKPPVELAMDSQGKVRVKGDHPDKEAIEALFEENPGMRNRFAALSSGTQLLEAMQEYLQFAKAYARDPAAAVQQYWYLFEDQDLASEVFTLTVGADEASEADRA